MKCQQADYYFKGWSFHFTQIGNKIHHERNYPLWSVDVYHKRALIDTWEIYAFVPSIAICNRVKARIRNGE